MCEVTGAQERGMGLRTEPLESAEAMERALDFQRLWLCRVELGLILPKSQGTGSPQLTLNF